MVKNYIPERGDLIWISFNPSLGHEQKGRRPAMVLTSSKYNKIGMVLICPITSAVKNYPFEVCIDSRFIRGAILSDQIRSVDWRNRKIEFIEKIEPDLLHSTQKNLTKLLYQ